jgi:hypothetical protein
VKPSRLVLVLVLAALVATSAAVAGSGDSYRLRYNAADQAAARAATLRLSDLPPSPRWNGWQHRPTSATLGLTRCAALPGRVSDLTVTGATDSWWERGPGFPNGPSLDTEARVFATARMASTDVRRSWPPRAVGCLRDQARSHPSVSPCGEGEWCTTPERLVSFGRIVFPRVAPFTLALRVVTQYKLTHGETRIGTARVTTLLVVLAKGRTVIALNAFGGRGSVNKSFVEQLARTLAGRVSA